MKRDFKRPNGTIKRVQFVKAFRGGVSSMGRRFKKGEGILHLSSSRNTGETFVLLPDELLKILMKAPGKWNSPKRWSEQLTAKWHRDNCWLVVWHGTTDKPCPLGEYAGPTLNSLETL